MSEPWPEFVLDASSWQSEDDFYDAFFTAVGAPDWHGRNLDALNDSIGTGGINRVETPYRIRVVGLRRMGPAALKSVERVIDFIRKIHDEGVDVAISCEP